MQAADSTPQRRLRLASIAILALGLIAAAFVYFSAMNHADDDSAGYQIVGGQAYKVDPSTRELSQTKRMGGQALVMTAQFNHWFASLWQGTRLAYTLAVLAAFTAWLCRHIAGLMDEDAEDD